MKRSGWLKDKVLTAPNLQFGPKLYHLAELHHPLRVHVVEEPLQMEHQDAWQCFDEDLLTGFDGNAGGRVGHLDGLRDGDASESVFDCVNGFGLNKQG